MLPRMFSPARVIRSLVPIHRENIDLLIIHSFVPMSLFTKERNHDDGAFSISARE